MEEDDTARPSSSPTTPTTPTNSSWTRQLPHPSLPLPQFPIIAGLRAALLGYLHEVERTVREQVTGDVVQEPILGPLDPLDESSVSSISDVDKDNEDAVLTASSSSSSASDFCSDSSLRRRNTGKRRQKATSPTVSASVDGDPLSMLDTLSALKEDVAKYLPSRSSFPTATTLVPPVELLRNLPSRLSIVDSRVSSWLGHSPGTALLTGPPGSWSPGSALGDQWAVERARERVIQLVHAYLPSEEWAGWERLGWEEQDREVPSRRHSVDLGQPNGEDEDEPEYLFPNRTPISAQGMAAVRRRGTRSKSVGAVGAPSKWSEITPRLHKTPTEPLLGLRSELGDDDKDEERFSAKDVDLDLGSDAVGEVKTLKATARGALGPSLAHALAQSSDGKVLITFADLPFQWRNNEHIITGYRFIPLHASTGPIPLIKSAFSWHNETGGFALHTKLIPVNIHSHFVPTLFILCFIPFIIWSTPLPEAHPLDTTTLAIYLLAAASCLISSAGWHVLSGCASLRWFEWGACVDYIGISWLIAASFFIVLYNAFYCQPKTVLFYSSINLTCGILGSYLPFQTWFNERRYKHLRIAFFLFLCVAMFAPVLQIFYEHGTARGQEFIGPFVPSILAYVTGLIFYAFHFPECAWPGRFDTWGMSHNLWHTGIVIAIVLHYRAVFTAHSVKEAYSCAMPDAGMPVGEVVELGLRKTARYLGLAA